LEIEGFYKLQVTPWFNVQPDIQGIIHPGGAGLRNACVTTLRVELDF
jgi:carbohydrate-selective porin OprB